MNSADFRPVSPDGARRALSQGRLFELSTDLGLSSDAFATIFMESDLAAAIDAWGSDLSEHGLMDALLKEKDVPEGPAWDRDAMLWIGYIYRYWSLATGASSKDIHKIANGRRMASIYPCGHMLDEERVIDDLLSDAHAF